MKSNIVRMLNKNKCNVTVVPYNTGYEEILSLKPDGLFISNGPGDPTDVPEVIETIKALKGKLPIFGICLGHQSIAEAFGATVSFAKSIMHGKQSEIEFKEENIFAGLNSPINVARYHSLAVIEETMPEELEVIARTKDNEIMAIKHKKYPIYGLQFHPESIYTEHGKKMVENFLEEAKAL